MMVDDNLSQDIERLKDLKSLDDNPSHLSVKDLESSIEKIYEHEKKASASNRESRDEITTKIYEKYKTRFENHNEFKKDYKKKLYSLCSNLMVVLTLGIVACILAVIFEGGLSLEESIAILVPSCVTYISSIISILTIIAKHLFPLDEEQYVNDIVTTIIETDLKSKKIDRDDMNK